MWKIGVLIIVMFTIICYFLAFFEKFEDIEIIVFFKKKKKKKNDIDIYFQSLMA